MKVRAGLSKSVLTRVDCKQQFCTVQDAEALVMYAGAAGLTCLSEVPLPRLPVTGDILGEAGQANAAPGALEELIGGGGSDSGADEDEESDESPSATQHTTSASPDDSVREPLPYQVSSSASVPMPAAAK